MLCSRAVMDGKRINGQGRRLSKGNLGLPDLFPEAFGEVVLLGSGHFLDLESTDPLAKDFWGFGGIAFGWAEAGRENGDALVGVVVFVGWEGGELLQGREALEDLAEDGVAAVVAAEVTGGDVELAAAGVALRIGRITEAGHADRA